MKKTTLRRKVLQMLHDGRSFLDLEGHVVIEIARATRLDPRRMADLQQIFRTLLEMERTGEIEMHHSGDSRSVTLVRLPAQTLEEQLRHALLRAERLEGQLSELRRVAETRRRNMSSLNDENRRLKQQLAASARRERVLQQRLERAAIIIANLRRGRGAVTDKDIRDTFGHKPHH